MWVTMMVSLVAALALGFLSAAWLFARERRRIQPIESLPRVAWGIVLGAPVGPEGPSPILEDRVRAGVELWHLGKVEMLLLSGDDGARRSDEVTVMRSLALALGVADAAIRLDPEGRTTLDTVRRAADVFGIEQAIVISQSFHLPRAIFLARSFGIEAHGLAADRRAYLHLRQYQRAEWVKAFPNALRRLLQPRGNKKR